MKNVKWILSALVATGMLATVLVGCNDDPPAAKELTLVSLTADGIDLNGATSAEGVAVGATIVAEFTTDVDETTVDAISLVRDYDDENYPVDVTVDGTTVTINPTDDFSTGTLFNLSFGVGLASTEGKTLSSAINRTYNTEGTFAVPGAFAQWTFEETADDVIGDFDPTANQIVDITYADSHNGDAGKAAEFNGTTSIIEVSDGDLLMSTNDFTISFWVKAMEHSDDIEKGHFVMGLGAFYGFQFEIFGGYGGWKLATRYAYDNGVDPPNTATEDNAFNGDGSDNTNGGWQGYNFTANLTESGGPSAILRGEWAHIVYVYNSTDKTGRYYANGELMRELDFDLWPVDDAKTFITGTQYGGIEPDVVNELAFGFIQSRAGTLWDAETWGGYDLTSANHFKGLLDDVLIYHKVISEEEITLMYNSGKP
jgi:hypothetical protein